MIEGVRVTRDKAGESYEVSVSEYPEECPSCKHKIAASYICAYEIGYDIFLNNMIQLVFRCNFSKCKRLFVAFYTENDQSPGYFMLNRYGLRIYSEAISVHDKIKKLSPGFANIQRHAKIAEDNGLLEVCGCGYRRALEFLVKDYLIYKNPKAKDVIRDTWLKDCIDRIEDDRIREMAKRAAWLGNDATHYYNKYKDKDLSNLKMLIELTMYWIQSELLTSEYKDTIKKK